MSELHIRRLRDRYEADGAAGIVDRRLGRAYHGRRRRTGLPGCSKNTGPGTGISRRSIFMNTWCAATALNMATPGPKPLCSGPTWCPMHRAGGGASQRWPQRPLPGMLVFQDGSPFRWLAGLGYDLDLIVTMDDATGEFYSAFLWPRKAPGRAFVVWMRPLPSTACFQPFIRAGAVTIFIPRRRAARSTRGAQRR